MIPLKTGTLFILFSFQLSTSSCSGQMRPSDKAEEPDIQYRVDKEYDKNGNLIRYDSSYTYSYSEYGKQDTLIHFPDQFFHYPDHAQRAFKKGIRDSIFLFPEPFHEFRYNDFFIEHRKMLEEFSRRFGLPGNDQAPQGSKHHRSQIKHTI